MTRFTTSYRGLGQLLRSPQMQAAMVTYAERAKVIAEAIAPIDTGGPHPGQYKGAFHVTSGVRRGRKGRAYARLTNTSDEAQFVEYGTVHNPAHHTLLNALVAMDQ